MNDFAPGSPLEESETIWNRPKPKGQSRPEPLEVWLIVAAACLCLSLLIAGMVRDEKAFGPGPVSSKVSR